MALTATPAWAQIQTVVLKGYPAPTAGAEFRKFRGPFIGDAVGERIGFRGASKGPGGGIHGVFRVDSSGSGTLIIQKGQIFGTGKFRNFRHPAINASGDLTFLGFLSGGGTGIFRTVGPTSPVTVTLVQEPTPVGGVFTEFSDSPTITSSGAVIFRAGTSAAGIEEGIFRCQGGNGSCFSGTGTGVMDTIVSTGDPIPDLPGREFCTFSGTVNTSPYGIAFRSTTKANCANAGEVGLDGIFRWDFAGSVGFETLALVGEDTDIAPPGVALYGEFPDAPDIEDDGIVTFRSDVTGSIKTEAVFLCDPGTCPASMATSIAQKGDLDNEGNELRRFAGAEIANNGDVMFLAKPRGPTANGPTVYFRRAGGLIERVVTKTDPVPDQAGYEFRRPGSPSLSPNGSVAFRAKMKQAGQPNNTGFFLLP